MTDFNFPFQPYDIQLQLMEAIHDAIETKKFALLESPTGTGKSLSLICSSLTWLRQHQAQLKKQLKETKEKLSSQIETLKQDDDWLNAQTKGRNLALELDEVNRQLESILKFEKLAEERHHAEHLDIAFEASKFQDEETEDVPEEACQRGEQQQDDQVRPKIYYASRTHSQLGQFVNEIKRTSFAKENPPIKVVSLASRSNMCVNPDVTKLKDPDMINERCLELSREPKKENRCPYTKPTPVNLLRDNILTSVQDIEDIVKRGKYLGACPYIASKSSLTEAEVVVLPYNNLLHHDTRKASNLDLKASIVIVDEAHNILETICSIHSSSITGRHLIGAHTILSRYHKKFSKKMNPKNAEMIKGIVNCLTSIVKFLDKPAIYLGQYDSEEKFSCNELMIDITKFIGASKIEKYNLFKIIDYLNRSQLPKKLIGFYKQDPTIDTSLELSDACLVEKAPNKKRKISDIQQNGVAPSGYSTCLSFLNLDKDLNIASYPIYLLIEFLKSLTNLLQDGKVMVNRVDGDILKSSLKFVLLNPANQFDEMVKNARSILLAGGTMQPFQEFVDLLFKPLGINKERLKLFSCGHVIGPEQLYVCTLTKGPTGRPLELSYKTRSNFDIVDEIGRCLVGISSSAPGGMVCFFPSYDYEQFCFNRWSHIGLIKRIEANSKIVLREPKQTAQMKSVWDVYTKAIENGKSRGRGSMLMCVVGGKMSEGINFNDDLGRCVVMIGLPYANIKSVELQQKMAQYNRTCGVGAGQEYYENLCIKGLNQSIGRSVRHKADYAAIVLLDVRYKTKQNIKDGLPKWICNYLEDHDSLNMMLSRLKTYYSSMEKEVQR